MKRGHEWTSPRLALGLGDAGSPVLALELVSEGPPSLERGSKGAREDQLVSAVIEAHADEFEYPVRADLVAEGELPALDDGLHVVEEVLRGGV